MNLFLLQTSHVYAQMNWPLDYISFLLLIWNFSVIGMFSIFWRAPTKVTQAYLVAISALMVSITKNKNKQKGESLHYIISSF